MLGNRHRNDTIVETLRIVPAHPRKSILIVRSIRPLRLTDIENLLQLVRNVVRIGTLVGGLVLLCKTDNHRLALRTVKKTIPLP